MMQHFFRSSQNCPDSDYLRTCSALFAKDRFCGIHVKTTQRGNQKSCISPPLSSNAGSIRSHCYQMVIVGEIRETIWNQRPRKTNKGLGSHEDGVENVTVSRLRCI
ncbi:NADH-ubiquinone oxidoreductase [Histoplasma capsulatum var. duboisii H88]|uniref:NADH-ubiquinone oxidoreductase n=1 Tax=Ajellomyces capsulatus (strain H88) TaxID=544711 RepID=A0A8A1LK55_AJEC8|nr:NADH-ubiquinone oxidoreductase [Histoplasma capsulatum var. duboisii H88]